MARLEPGAVSILGMMSPLTAVTLGWLWLGQSLSSLQVLGAAIILGSIWAGQRANGRLTTRDSAAIVPKFATLGIMGPKDI